MRAGWCLVVLVASGCQTYALTAENLAGCETAPVEITHADEAMAPGAVCLACHRGLTAAGTVFQRVDSACEPGGVANVRVELLDGAGKVAVATTTNQGGNFFTRKRLPVPYTVRITGPDGTVREMREPVSDGSCARCHAVPGVDGAPGRIALQL